jgi:hypothetical protein
MRRLALSALTLSGFGLLAGCGGSGFSSGSSSSSITGVAFTNGSGQADDFFVTPGGLAPLQVNAVGYNGSGPSPQYVPGGTFTWGARYVDPTLDPPSVAQYAVGSSSGSQPSSFKTCPAKPAILPAIPILVFGGSGTPSKLYPGYNELGANQPASTVYVGSVPGQSAKSYCLRLEASPTTGGTGGGVTVIVATNP